jgi:hypothetical protein
MNANVTAELRVRAPLMIMKNMISIEAYLMPGFPLGLTF